MLYPIIKSPFTSLTSTYPTTERRSSSRFTLALAAVASLLAANAQAGNTSRSERSWPVGGNYGPAVESATSTPQSRPQTKLPSSRIETVIFLGGLGSKPSASYLGTILRKKLAESNIDFIQPSLNRGEGGFRKLTIGRVLDQTRKRIQHTDPEKLAVIGGSLGGVVAAYLAAIGPPIAKTFLIDPAFDYPAICHGFLGEKVMEAWSRDGAISFPLPGPMHGKPLGYGLIRDAEQHFSKPPIVGNETVVFRNKNDKLIPLNVVEDFVKANKDSNQYSPKGQNLVRLELLEGYENHELGDENVAGIVNSVLGSIAAPPARSNSQKHNAHWSATISIL